MAGSAGCGWQCRVWLAVPCRVWLAVQSVARSAECGSSVDAAHVLLQVGSTFTFVYNASCGNGDTYLQALMLNKGRTARMLGVMPVPLPDAKALGFLSEQDAQIAADTESTVEV